MEDTLTATLATECTARQSAWSEPPSYSTLDPDQFRRLISNQIPYVRIPDFASQEECERLIAAASNSAGFSPYRGVEPRINRIGNTVFEYDKISRDAYFENNPAANLVQEQIFNASFNPVNRLMALLHQATGRTVRRATRGDGALYFAGLIRRIEEGTLLHVDFAPAEQRGWEVAQVTSQLSWNLYLRTSGLDDGRTHIYERQWQPADDEHREGSYGYAERLVRGSKKIDFLPVVGEVVIFNTRNFHYVDKTSGERVTVTSALGTLPHGEIVLWS